MPDIDPKEILDTLKFDKKRAAGSLQLVLLQGIGKPLIVSEKDIPKIAMTKAVKSILKNKTAR